MAADYVPFDALRGVVCVDLETCSAAELSDYGAWAYSQHESTQVWTITFCYFDEAARSRLFRWGPGDTLPPRFVDYVRAGGSLLAHNAAFEFSIWSNILVPRWGFPPTTTDQWRDTQAEGCAANLPASLEGLAEALGTPTQKDQEGKRLMKRLAYVTETESGYVYPSPSGVELARLQSYCDADVIATAQAYAELEPLTVTELRVWELDKRINARGVYLDVDYAGRLERLAAQRVQRLADAALETSLAEVDDAASSNTLKRWLHLKGVELPKVRKFSKARGEYYVAESADKKALDVLLARTDLTPDVRAVLVNRKEATRATSLRKLRRVPLMRGTDGRLRFALNYCAAHTGRWSSYGLQIHNLPKDKLSPEESRAVDVAIATESIEALELAAPRPLEALSQKLRGVIAAAPGHDLIAADFASIEACVCAWLAGQQDKLDFLHRFFVERRRFLRGELKTKPQDLYEFAAESIGSTSRQLGKVAELALQYGMGDFKFADTANAAKVPLSVKEAAKVKRAWRRTNVQIVAFWKELEQAAIAAVQARGSWHRVGLLRLIADADCLQIELPSGRVLRYWRPQVRVTTKTVRFVDDEGETVETELTGPTLTFWTQDESKSGMVLTETYGGSAVENVTQAVARDLLAEALLRLESKGYPVVMHVHDSIACEVPAGTGSVEEFCAIMREPPRWADGCPIDADGYRGRRFRG